MNTLSFLDQLAMALAYRQYNFHTYCIAHELNPTVQWVKVRWYECGIYSNFYRALSDEAIMDLLDNSPIE